jgi:hypothetical protein
MRRPVTKITAFPNTKIHSMKTFCRNSRIYGAYGADSNGAPLAIFLK